MDLSIKGKNAIVCASSQGLGKSAAIDLAKEGVNLVICSRNKNKINLIKDEIEEVALVDYETALNLLTHKEDKKILKYVFNE